MSKVIIIVFLFVVLFQTSCNRCRNIPVTPTLLTDYEQSFVPYKGDEVLKFLSNGDTLILKGNGVHWTNERSSSVGGDCTEEFLLAVKNYNFSSPDYTLIIKLSPEHGSNSAEIYIGDITQRGLAKMEIPFYLEYSDFKYKGLPSDSITILGKTYYNVYGYEPGFIYNLSEGVLRLRDCTYKYPNLTCRLFERIL